MLHRAVFSVLVAIVLGMSTPAAKAQCTTAVSITTQPADKDACSGDTVTFNVVATGNPAPTYQWQKGGTNISNGGPISGATTATLRITNVGPTDAANYRCRVTNACGTVNTVNASLSVRGPLSVSSPPSTLDVCAGSNASFSVSAVDTVNGTDSGITYQWQRALPGGSFLDLTDSSGSVSGATTNTLLIQGTTAGSDNDGARFRCRATNACGGSNSGSCTLSVLESRIVSQPVSQTICEGNDATFGITTAGAEQSYRWERTDSNGNFTALSNNTVISGATSPTLVLNSPAIGSNNDGAQFRCRVTRPGCPDVLSNTVTLTINPGTTITTQPVSQDLCVPSNATFSVAATGAGLTYQWQRSVGGASFANLTNAGNISGATSAALTIQSPQPGGTNDGAQFRCTITGACGNLTSSIATLTVSSPALIVTSPVAQIACEDSNAVFSVSASGNYLTYQWQRSVGTAAFTNLSDGPNITGTTTNTLTIQTPSIGGTNDGARFRCRVTNGCGTLISTDAALTVNPATIITTQPVAQTICSGDDAVFSIAATGVSLSYQWQRAVPGEGFTDLTSGPNFSGTATPTLTILTATNGSVNDGASFRCRITSSCGVLASAAVVLGISPITSVNTQPVAQTGCEGGSAIFSITATGAGLTYQWQRASVGTTTFSNLSDGTNITGTSTPILTLQNLNPGGPNDGARFRCRVTSACGNVSSDAVILTINPATVITTQPADRVACDNDVPTFTVTAAGPGLTYRWQRSHAGGNYVDLSNGPQIGGSATDTLTILSASAYDGDRFRCRVTGTCGAVDSVGALLTSYQTPSFDSPPTDQTVCEGSNVVFVAVAIDNSLAFRWEKRNAAGSYEPMSDSASYTGTATNTLTVINPPVGPSGGTNRFRCRISNPCGQATSPIVTFTVNANSAITSQPSNVVMCTNEIQTVAVSATGPNLAYRWQVSFGGPFADVTNTPPFSNIDSRALVINFPSVSLSGFRVRCVITSDCGTLTTNPATVTVNGAPVIGNQPLDWLGACPESTVMFQIFASGSGLSYQWQRALSGGAFADLADGPDVTGATTTTLSLLNVSDGGTNDGAQFRCRVSSATCGSTDSNPATLIVNTSPAIATQPVDQTVCAGSSATFSIAATGTDPLYYVWQRAPAGGTFTDLSANALGFTGTRTATLTLLNATIGGTNNGAQFRCIVSTTCSIVISDPATLTVDRTPSITTQPVDQTACAGSSATLSIAANGSDLSYQWQQAPPGGAFADLADGPDVTGATTATLTLLNLSDGGTNDGAQFRCRVTSATCGSVDTNPVTLTVFSPPVITAQPQNARTCQTAPAAFTVSILEGPAPTFRWQWLPTGSAEWSDLVNGTNSVAGTPLASAAGVDTPVLSLTPMAGPASAAQVRCVVTAAACPTQSTSAAFTVCAADYNCSGNISVQDIFDFLAGYFSGAPAADVNLSGSITVQDIFDFLSFYFAGCP